FSADEVPVGEDQIQHVEIARDIAQKVNHSYGELLKLPKFVAQKNKTIPGLDGRKMSKSYGNHIPLFVEAKQLRKLIMKIKTDSSPPETPKDPNDSLIFDLYKEFASPEQIVELKQRYEKGIGWGEAKQILFELVDQQLSPMRDEFHRLMADKPYLDKLLKEGSVKAREQAQALLSVLRKAMGIGVEL
ncbi:MAG: hypothetical protein KDD40_11545, partial [Bdellovibrionales bacterium]|nr:hypothetical protein [Bdellovibrionales bacterium]